MYLLSEPRQEHVSSDTASTLNVFQIPYCFDEFKINQAVGLLPREAVWKTVDQDGRTSTSNLVVRSEHIQNEEATSSFL